MRKLITIIFFSLVICFNATDALCEEDCKIIYIKGTVKIQHPGDVFWVLAKKSMSLNDKDKIKTFIGSEAEIALDASLKNIVRLEPDTEILIQELKGNKFAMPKGEIMALIEALPSRSSFEIRTPTAVAGVAGSGMSVRTDGKKTFVKCFEDKAYAKGIASDGRPMPDVIIISEGYKRVVDRFQEPGELMVLTTLDRENWTQFRENLRAHLDSLRERRAQGSREAALEMYEIEKMRRRDAPK